MRQHTRIWSAAVVIIGLVTWLSAVRAGPNSAEPFTGLADPDPSVRSAAVAALADRDDPRVLPALNRALADPEWEVQLAAAKILGPRDDPAIRGELIEGLDSDDVPLRKGCVLALAHSLNSQAIEALAAQCKKRNFAFRWQVSEAIGRAGNRAVVPVLLQMLRGGADWRAQEMAIMALARMHENVGIDPLLQALESQDAYIRKLACWQLSVIGDPRALPTLIDDILEKYDTYDTRIWGALAIHSITKEASGIGPSTMAREPAKFLQWWAQNKHRYVNDE